MTATLPAPKVPDVGPDNVIDLDKLGNADLKTWVDYPRIAEGDGFWPTLWGRSASGEAVDDFNELVVIGPGELKPEGMPVLISNGKLKALKGGQVFYSYKMHDPDAPDGRGEESLRRFFYVGKPSSASLQLPVLHFKESHSLCVDLDQIGDGGATLVATPYQAMSVGDVFTFVFDMYFEEDEPWQKLTYAKELLEADIGKPLQWSIPKNELQIIQGGFANMGYRIDYAEPTVTSESAIQTVHVIAPPDTLLPAPKVKGLDGNELDPDVHPDGIMLAIKLYPGIQVGDYVVVYAESDTSIYEERDDVDDPAGGTAPRQIYAATYDEWNRLKTETEFDWLDRQALALTSSFEYDDWGAQRCVTGPVGVKTFEVTDPIGTSAWSGPIQRSWREGTGATAPVGKA
ncbi:hypothetical protein BJ917_0013 [Pseudomonas sp. WPR_5_2]|uniref:hypothetical protein n=1 Tax=Pseudomonas sp. WPR_5_2 TaxID=1907371 RepID=UPI000F2A2EFC|nr:hypothetical protein [Pseudomonas sp. WPR_5_2]RKS27177.1 hypothetical protein BJ917_0013 [Pseudomonas sp. WPR_5_2]